MRRAISFVILAASLIVLASCDLFTGPAGTRSVWIQMYLWADDIPTVFPEGTSTYTWSLGTFTEPETPNGWSSIPGTGASGGALYMCRAYYSDSDIADTSTITWPGSGQTAAVISVAGQDGTDGTDGVDGQDETATLFIHTATGGSYNDACFGNGIAVAVSPYGNIDIMTTADTGWLPSEGSADAKNAVAYGTIDGVPTYVAVGETGVILYSQDGCETWFSMDSGTTTIDLVDVTYGAGRFVAVGNGILVVSPATNFAVNTTWTDATPTETNLDSVNFVNGLFLAGVYYSGGVYKYFYRSTDGVTWEAETSDLTMIQGAVVGFAYGNGVYLVLGSDSSLFRSTDGVTWSSVDIIDSTATYADLAFDGDSFFLLKADGSLYKTGDGGSWSIYAPLPTCGGTYTYTSLTLAPTIMTGGAFIVSRL